jgi:hypothetical protein
MKINFSSIIPEMNKFKSKCVPFFFRHDLFGVVHDKIPDLMELDEREALKLFLEHPEKLSSDLVRIDFNFT